MDLGRTREGHRARSVVPPMAWLDLSLDVGPGLAVHFGVMCARRSFSFVERVRMYLKELRKMVPVISSFLHRKLSLPPQSLMSTRPISHNPPGGDRSGGAPRCCSNSPAHHSKCGTTAVPDGANRS
eukprot:gene8518-biopygen100